MTRSVIGWVAWVAIVAAAGGIGAVASINAVPFYRQLVRPTWAPPAAVFGPVWSVLYVAMATAAWMVWRARGLSGARGALTLFLVQLAANALWTWLFFAWRRGAWAFGEVLGLWALIAATIVTFWRVRPVAGALLIPYLLWVTFATALTWSVWRRNPGQL